MLRKRACCVDWNRVTLPGPDVGSNRTCCVDWFRSHCQVWRLADWLRRREPGHTAWTKCTGLTTQIKIMFTWIMKFLAANRRSTVEARSEVSDRERWLCRLNQVTLQGPETGLVPSTEARWHSVTRSLAATRPVASIGSGHIHCQVQRLAETGLVASTGTRSHCLARIL